MTLETGQVEVAGSNARYWAAGSGAPVVILDGDGWSVLGLQQALAKDYRVLRLDLGDFSGPGSEQELAGLAALAVGALGYAKYTLIGASVSAGVALWQTLQSPGDVEALILISPIAILPTGNPATALAEQLVARPENAARLAAGPRAMTSPGSGLLSGIAGSGHNAELESRLTEVSCPTLVVFGLKDRMVAPEAARVYREKIPNSNVSMVYDAGHVIMADRPEALTGLVADFVERREAFVVGRQSSIINP